MDSGAPMILPKGIVTNSKNIYREVAEYTVVPPDKVWEYWHVYTTTYKRLKDPTACRLENFWWHVWGSNRRFLKGSTLAKLYEEISLGPTSVPLKGPPNRWEGPDIPPIIKQLMEAVQAEFSPQPPPQEFRSSSKANDLVLRTLSSSASKPPPPHPILKKARGPSSSGPRPTARFVSPHESADEGEIPSSGSTAATASEAPIYVVPSPKKQPSAPTPNKLVAVSTATNTRKKPTLSKNHSADVGSREPGPSSGSRYAGVQRPVTPITEQDSEQATSASEDSSSFILSERPAMSEKALGKQPANPRRPISMKNGTQHEVPALSPMSRLRPVEHARPVLLQAQSLIDLPGHTRRRDSAASRSTLGVGSLESGSGFDGPPTMARSLSHGGCDPAKYPSNRRSPGLFTGAKAETTNVAVKGTILDQTGLGTSMPQPSMLGELSSASYSIPLEPSILDSRLTPTQPSTSESVPLARTKSQLTLLLEREKSRSGSKPRSKN
ncbi:hypothetical protein B0J13DRAFT_520214 [Dactylonectria estremocensis]|uniref:Nitrogen regulatory protein areA GATA-like domain-containing protein n=1 Tax=Dactylonectria estremocensis TaxID=1079267 RepID=A0A9P9FCJ2_9HYPO|nr:hypothetical protein B0J13DRAFT_520214 [Dactylonectria estremocensis]